MHIDTPASLAKLLQLAPLARADATAVTPLLPHTEPKLTMRPTLGVTAVTTVEAELGAGTARTRQQLAVNARHCHANANPSA